MGRFDLKAAVALARSAVRKRNQSDPKSKEDGPLVGKEQALLKALTAAEIAHDAQLASEKQESARYLETKNQRDLCHDFSRHISEATKVWRQLEEDGQLGLAWFAAAGGMAAGDWDGESNEWLQQTRRRLHEDLIELDRAARSATEVAFPRGRKKNISQSVGVQGLSLEPLMAFGRVMKAFLDEATPDGFGQEFGPSEARAGQIPTHEPKSAASRLMWDAVQYLSGLDTGQRYTMANVETVMKALQRASVNSG